MCRFHTIFAFIFLTYLSLTTSQIINNGCRSLSAVVQREDCPGPGGRDLNREQCALRNCCFFQRIWGISSTRCYARLNRRSIGFPRPRPSPATGGGSFGSSTTLVLGGVPGYPGSTVQLQCSRNSRRPCRRNPVPNDETTCRAYLCCWVGNSCVQGTFRIIRLRSQCEPGFTNPPKCEDIDECANTPCQNGGICSTQGIIGNFTCQCPVPITGYQCENVCQYPPTIPNGSTNPAAGPFNYGETVNVTCNYGYVLDGSWKVSCQNNGQFSQPLPTCVRACTTTPPANTGVAFTPSTPPHTSGTTIIQYSCDTSSNILVPNPATNQCGTDGQWLFASPNCFSCGPPPGPNNGFFTQFQSNYFANATVTYQCNVGYVLDGISINTCNANGQWSQTTAPQCDNQVCPPLSEINKATVDPATVTQGPSPIMTVATYTCNGAYYIEGAGVTSRAFTCEDHSPIPVWTPIGDLPVCVRGCLPPSVTAPLMYMPNTLAVFPVGLPALFHCADGYTLNGDLSTACSDISFIFEGMTANCIQNCGPPPGPPMNGELVGVNEGPDTVYTYPIGAIATYSCETGYAVQGDPTIACLDTGMWETLSYMCLAGCNAPTVTITNGMDLGADPTVAYNVSAMLTYTCNPGFTTTGTVVTECQDTSFTWTLDSSLGPNPACARFCPNPPDPIGSIPNVALTGLFFVLSDISYSCTDTLFQITPDVVSTCQSDGNWMPDINDCMQYLCGSPVPDPITGGAIENPQANYMPLTSAQYTCSPGLVDETGMNGFTTTCNNDFTWSLENNSPACFIRCTTIFNVPVDVTVSPDPATNVVRENGVIDFVCMSPEDTISPSSATCQDTGMFDPPDLMAPGASCVQTRCLPPTAEDITQGTTLTGLEITYDVGAMLTYTCSSGYSTRADVTVCEGGVDAAFAWTLDLLTPAPACTRICPIPPSPTANTILMFDGSVITSADLTTMTFLATESIDYTCNTGLIPAAATVNTCNIDGSGNPVWSTASLPDCGCPTLPAATGDGAAVPTIPSPFTPGIDATYNCMPGATLAGSQTNTCNNDGAFVNTPPVCTTPCMAPPVVPNAAITLGMMATYFDSATISYTCAIGFSPTTLNTIECTCTIANLLDWSCTPANTDTACQRDRNIVLVMDPSNLNSNCAGSSTQYNANQRSFINNFNTNYGTTFIADTAVNTNVGTRIAVTNLDTASVCVDVSPFTNNVAMRMTAVDLMLLPCLSIYNPADVAQCPPGAGRNPNIQTVYVVLINIPDDTQAANAMAALASISTSPWRIYVVFVEDIPGETAGLDAVGYADALAASGISPGSVLGTLANDASNADTLVELLKAHINVNP